MYNKFSKKSEISYPLMRKRTCRYQSRGEYRPKLRSVTEIGICAFGIPNSQTQYIYIYIYIWYKYIKQLKLNKKTKEKENEVNIYKSAFNTTNNIIFISNFCFDSRELLLYILLHSLYSIIALIATFSD